MISLHINIDHVATIRQARQINEPDPITAAGLIELAGADGITGEHARLHWTALATSDDYTGDNEKKYKHHQR